MANIVVDFLNSLPSGQKDLLLKCKNCFSIHDWRAVCGDVTYLPVMLRIAQVHTESLKETAATEKGE